MKYNSRICYKCDDGTSANSGIVKEYPSTSLAYANPKFARAYEESLKADNFGLNSCYRGFIEETAQS
jgi:hypothetical protein